MAGTLATFAENVVGIFPAVAVAVLNAVANNGQHSSDRGKETKDNKEQVEGGRGNRNDNDANKMSEFLKDPNKHAEQKAKDKRGNNKLYKYGDSWYSPDKARHGGSKYKVFDETRGELVLKRSVDKSGNIMSNKHESMKSFTIPKSEIKNYPSKL